MHIKTRNMIMNETKRILLVLLTNQNKLCLASVLLRTLYLRFFYLYRIEIIPAPDETLFFFLFIFTYNLAKTFSGYQINYPKKGTIIWHDSTSFLWSNYSSFSLKKVKRDSLSQVYWLPRKGFILYDPIDNPIDFFGYCTY